MRRATLLLFFSLLGGGCVSRNCLTDVTLYWIFPNADGTAELSCDQAGVTSVQVTIDGVAQQPLACTQPAKGGGFTQGAVYQDFESRQHEFRIDGLDAAGRATYSDAFTFAPAACSDNRLERTLTPLGGSFFLEYARTDAQGNSVACRGTGFVWYEVLDQNGVVYSTVSAAAGNASAIPCGANQVFAIEFQGAPYGKYTLSRIQEVVPSQGGYAVVAANCSPISFQHLAPNDGISVTIPNLAAGQSGCF